MTDDTRKTIGLVQSRGLGDIIIALPIARYLHAQGHRVVWPIDRRALASFQPAAPYVDFLPLEQDAAGRWFYETPIALLKRAGCDRIIPLYNFLSGHPDIVNERISGSLKFDEYKYAQAGVPFREKWRLSIERDRDSEERLFRKKVPSGAGEYVCCHLQGSDGRARYDMAKVAASRPVIEITPATRNLFDWLTIIERAALFVGVDSCFTNLVDQLAIEIPKIFICRSDVAFTPVLGGAWDIIR